MLQLVEPATNATQRAVWGGRELAPTEVGSLAADVAQSPKVINLWKKAAKPAWSSTLFENWPVPQPRPMTDPASETVCAGERSREDKLAAELMSYRHLPHGWDGYDGIPAPLLAVRDALTFLTTRPHDIPLPYPQIGPDGEVGLYWDAGEVFAEVSFYGDGEYSYHARYTPARGHVSRSGRDGCRLDADGWDTGLLLMLNKISR